MGGEGLSESDATALPANELEQSPESGEAKSEAIRFDSQQLDPDLLAIIDAWLTLSPAARQAVLSLVSREAEGNRDA